MVVTLNVVTQGHLSHHRLLVPYPRTAFSGLDRFSDWLCSSVCFIFLSLFLISFWSRVAD